MGKVPLVAVKNDAGKYVPRAQESKSGSHNRYLFGENLALTAEGVAALVKNNGNASQRVVYTRVYHCHNRSTSLCSWEMEEQRSLADIEQRGLSLTFRGIHSCPELTTWRNDVAAGKEPPSLTPRTRQVRRVAANNDPPPPSPDSQRKLKTHLLHFCGIVCVCPCVCVCRICVCVCARARPCNRWHLIWRSKETRQSRWLTFLRLKESRLMTCQARSRWRTRRPSSERSSALVLMVLRTS